MRLSSVITPGQRQAKSMALTGERLFELTMPAPEGASTCQRRTLVRRKRYLRSVRVTNAGKRLDLDQRERLRGRGEGAIDIGGCVGAGEKKGFELRRGDVDTAVEQGAEPGGKRRGVRGARFGVIRHRALVEEESAHRAEMRCLNRDTGIARGSSQSIDHGFR